MMLTQIASVILSFVFYGWKLTLIVLLINWSINAEYES